ncbi:MAG: YegS/Rv2252/BmrU family lipid kinase [Anaerolineae bacterium]|nr:YegS/Rv2252/BmrU family lipid kinase [Anaerolineae bacterium]
MEPKTCIIFNPQANRGTAAGLLPDLERCLGEHGQADLVQTTRPGEAAELAAQALERGFERIVAAGGDGTVHEIVNGCQSHAGAEGWGALGIIPIGSGNDLAWTLGFSPDLKTACARVFAGERREIDLGRITDGDGRSRYFCNGVGIGFDGTVAREVQRITWAGGFAKYLIGLARTFIFYYDAPQVTIRYNDQEICDQIMMLTVSNGRRHGGGFIITPDATLDDGCLDLCIVRRVGRLGILQLIPKFLKGVHVDDARVQMDRGGRVIVKVPDGLATHLDGEIFSDAARWLDIEILPRRLAIIT